MSGKISLRKFDMKTMADDATVLLVAPRRSGKTVMLCDILYNKRDFPCGMLMSGSEKMTPTFGKIVPELFIYDNFDSNAVSNLMERQIEIVDKVSTDPKYKKFAPPELEFGKEKYRMYMAKEAYKHSGPDCRAWLVLDDLLPQFKEIFKNERITEIFANGRHFNLLFLMTTQNFFSININVRDNFEYIFIFKGCSDKELKKLYDQYASFCETFTLFREIINEFTQNYGCVIINKRAVTKEICDNIFFYKADPSIINDTKPEHMVLCKQAWNYNKKYYNKEHKDKKKGIIVNVKGKQIEISKEENKG